MPLRLARCAECRERDERYCPHRGVLLMFIAGEPLIIRSRSEDRARALADRLRIHWRGAPFQGPRESSMVGSN
jgi:hypothetical protein